MYRASTMDSHGYPGSSSACTRTGMCAELVRGYGGVGLWDKVCLTGGLARIEPCW